MDLELPPEHAAVLTTAAGARNNLGAPYAAFVNRYRVLHGKEAMQEKSHSDCAAILRIADFIASEENNT